ncbi:MAG: hypothetical protein C5B51_32175, partial [Terriglobia bacterium]
SRYSQDLQAVINRAVQIASLPITQLNNEKAHLSDQSSALAGLDTVFLSLQTAIGAIGSALGSSSYTAHVSDSSKLSVTLGAGAGTGTYSIDILSAGKYASSLTLNPWDNTTGHTYKLSLKGQDPLALTVDSSDTPQAVAAAINSQYGDKVSATVVNVGGDTPDYRISLQGLTLADLQPDILVDGSSTGIQDPKVTGEPASYTMNGSATTATSASRAITVANGVVFNLAAGATGTVDVTVSRSTAALSSALANLATAYNAVVDALAKQRGSSAGPLSGEPVLNQVSQALRDISTYGGQPGAIDGLRSLGLTLDNDGHLSFDSTTFQATAGKSLSSLDTFFGSPTTSGFLKLATDRLNTVEQPTTGLLPAAEAAVTAQSNSLTTQISNQQDRVDRLQQQLTTQMSAADALIASMEQNYNYIYGMFQAMQTAAQQYK